TRSSPFERPAFTVDTATTPPVVSYASPGAALKLVALNTTQLGAVGLPYSLATGNLPGPVPISGVFHPTPATCNADGKQVQDPSQSCTPGQSYTDANQSCGGNHPVVSTQVYLKPLDTGSALAPIVSVNACQFCTATTGSQTCGNGTPSSQLDTFTV